MSARWPRMVALVDMNAFFASCEQRDHPAWRGRPVGVTNGVRGTCLITCSYEARAHGIKTGMRLPEARRRCPGLIQAPSRPHVYAATSTAIMQSLETITPVMEVFSVDEAFLDLTGVQHLHDSVEAIGRAIKRAVFEASGLLCSVGISADKTTAKWAAKQHKPDGMMIVSPDEAAERLACVAVTDLCGIGPGIGRFLAQRGVHTCADMQRLPMGELTRRFGPPGRRIWLMAQGLDPSPVETRDPAPQSIGHGKVLPPRTTSRSVLRTYLSHMAYKVARRLRRHGLQAAHFHVALKSDLGWIKARYATRTPSNDGHELMRLAERLLREHWHGFPVHQVQFTALDPVPADLQGDLFEQADTRARARDRAVDAVAARFGEAALMPARLLGRSDMPDVIAPAWRPDGHRQTLHR